MSVVCAANWTLILEYIKVFLQWPPIVLLIVVCLFRRFPSSIQRILDQFANLMTRVKKVSVVDFTPPQPEVETPREIKDKAVTTITATLHAVEEPDKVEIVATQTPPKREEAPAQTIEVPGIPPPEIPRPSVTNKDTSDALALAAKWLHFERSLNAIFGSQFNFLVLLAGTPDGMDFFQARAYFVENVPQQTKAVSSFESWIGWLQQTGYVEFDTVNHSYKLTPQGREFLAYLPSVYRTGMPIRNG